MSSSLARGSCNQGGLLSCRVWTSWQNSNPIFMQVFTEHGLTQWVLRTLLNYLTVSYTSFEMMACSLRIGIHIFCGTDNLQSSWGTTSATWHDPSLVWVLGRVPSQSNIITPQLLIEHVLCSSEWCRTGDHFLIQCSLKSILWQFRPQIRFSIHSTPGKVVRVPLGLGKSLLKDDSHLLQRDDSGLSCNHLG